MATITPLLFSLLFLFIISGEIMGLAEADGGSQEFWCVAKPSSSDKELQDNINYACNNINCEKIQAGGACSEPQTLINRASVAMNTYYQKNGRNYWNCDFGNSGLITVKDPSYGNCKYDY